MRFEEYQLMYEVEDRLWWYKGMETITRALIERFYPRGAGLRILDAGCGTGAVMGYLADYGVVTGIDYSSDALRFCLTRGRSRLARGSADALPFADASFDLVTSFDVLCVHTVNDMQALSEFCRVLVPGGRVILRLPAYNWLRGAHDRAVDIARRYTAAQVRAYLECAGLIAEHISYANMWLFPVALFKRFLEPLVLPQRGSDLSLDPGPFNKVLRMILSSEAHLVAGYGLPFGLTVAAIGRRLEK